MASVFLSYDRDDAARARSIADALEKAGHSVWWDRRIRGGAEFSAEIEQALEKSDSVVVLWSKESVKSPWVRDEAAAGRDTGRLIPATIDGTEPPLGFRQFQTIDLSDWKRGAKSPGSRQLEAAITQTGPARASRPETSKRPSRQLPSSKIVAYASPVLLAAIALGAYLLWPSPSAQIPTVSVVPASNSAMSQELSRDLFAKLGILQAANSSALQLVEAATADSPDLIFKVDASNDGSASKASLLLLSGKNRELLWSGDFDQPSGNASDLKQQLAYGAANILDCASEVYGPSGRSLNDKIRRLYLTGCGHFTQLSNADLNSLIRTFREVTRQAPEFDGGWARLLEAEDESIFYAPWENDTAEGLAQFKMDTASARKFNADLAEAYIGESDVIARDHFPEGIEPLETAVRTNPDHPSALGALSVAYMQVGRMKDAVTAARRAVQIRPFSPRAQDGYISALIYAGQFEAARKELSKMEALFPGASNVSNVRFRLNLRYGSAQDALKQAKLEGDDYGLEPFLKARIDRSPANIAAAIDATRNRLDGSSIATADYLQALAEFGRSDDLIDFLLRSPKVPNRGRFIGVLFRPTFRAFWNDPRSMRVAARFGLVQYWKTADHWPDFCEDPRLPYDCKAEAAKLG